MAEKLLRGGSQEAKLSLEMGLRTYLCHVPWEPQLGRAEGQAQPNRPRKRKSVCLVWQRKDGEEAEGGCMGPDCMDLHLHSWGKVRFSGKDLGRGS